jgi:nitronate monooxygenase
VLLDRLEIPVVLAPLGGGPSTPELAAAVSDAGGFGFLAGSYLSPDELAGRCRATRALTLLPYGANLFCPVPGPADPSEVARYAGRLRDWGASRGFDLGEPRFTDDGFAEKVAVLADERPAVVSFTFGLPPAGAVETLRAAGAEIWITVTTPDEARAAAEAGADALVVQGAEAGGHRGGFRDDDEQPLFGLLALLQLIASRESIPLVASGGLMNGHGIAAVICAGARAAQLGTAFMLCPEAGTSEPHRRALRGNAPTTLTRAFTGRLARGIRNEFIAAHDDEAPLGYPEIHYVTAPMRAAARAADDPSLVNLWAGEAYPLARELPAAELVRLLAQETREALAASR